MQNTQQVFEFFEGQAYDVGRHPIEDNLASIIKDGLTTRKHTLDARHRSSQRAEGTPELYVEYRDGDDMMPFVRLCRENEEKAQWLIRSAGKRALGLMTISQEQQKILDNVRKEK